MAKFERGDVVCYVYPAMPAYHGMIALVESYNPLNKYPVLIKAYISTPRDFIEMRGDTRRWIAEVWEKVGHIDI